MPTLARIAPEVPVSNLRLSMDYYEEKLGFEVAMEMPDGDYAIMERDDVAIHLFQADARVIDDSGNEIKFTDPLAPNL